MKLTIEMEKDDVTKLLDALKRIALALESQQQKPVCWSYGPFETWPCTHLFTEETTTGKRCKSCKAYLPGYSIVWPTFKIETVA